MGALVNQKALFWLTQARAFAFLLDLLAYRHTSFEAQSATPHARPVDQLELPELTV